MAAANLTSCSHPSWLQIQLRDVTGFVETRHQLLILKPANRNHWISFAVAHHLDKNYELAVQVWFFAMFHAARGRLAYP